MGKTPLPKDEALQPLNVKVPMEDLYFLQEELKPAFGVSYNAEAMRQLLAQLRTWFRLPAYVVDRLKKDAASQKLHLLDYLQMLLAQALRGAGRRGSAARDLAAAGQNRQAVVVPPDAASVSQQKRSASMFAARLPSPGLRPTRGRPLRASRASPFAARRS